MPLSCGVEVDFVSLIRKHQTHLRKAETVIHFLPSNNLCVFSLSSCISSTVPCLTAPCFDSFRCLMIQLMLPMITEKEMKGEEVEQIPLSFFSLRLSLPPLNHNTRKGRTIVVITFMSIIIT